MNRRSFLAGAAASVAAVATPSAQPKPFRTEVSLKALAAEKSLEISTAYYGGRGFNLENLIAHHCDIVTPETAMKPEVLAPRRSGKLAFEQMDAIASFCRANALRLHGHALYWHQTQPAWLNDAESGTFVRDYMAYTRKVMTRYADLTVSWDVINEPFSDRALGYRKGPVLDRHGDEFLLFLFRIARRAAPKAKLLINDYGLSCGAAYCQRKRDTALATVERLMKTGLSIDAVGLQAHLLPTQPVHKSTLNAFIRGLGELGLEVYITELDVNDIELPQNIAKRDKLIAAIYSDYLGGVLENDNVKRLGFWGLSDAGHWIVTGHAPFKRKHGAPRPALFDGDLQPKPAFFAVVDALKQAPNRA